jgi:hypothetical protein
MHEVLEGHSATHHGRIVVIRFGKRATGSDHRVRTKGTRGTLLLPRTFERASRRGQSHRYVRNERSVRSESVARC